MPHGENDERAKSKSVHQTVMTENATLGKRDEATVRLVVGGRTPYLLGVITLLTHLGVMYFRSRTIRLFVKT